MGTHADPNGAARVFAADVDAHGSAVGEQRPVGLCHAPGAAGHPRHGRGRPLSRLGHRTARAGAGWQRRRRGRGGWVRAVAAQAAERRHRRRGADSHPPRSRRSERGDQRPGLGAPRSHHRLVPLARHRADSIRRVPASHRARPVRRLVYRAAAASAPPRWPTSSGPAVDLADGGFPMYATLRNAIPRFAERYRAGVAHVGRDLPASAVGCRGRHARHAIRTGREPSRPRSMPACASRSRESAHSGRHRLLLQRPGRPARRRVLRPSMPSSTAPAPPTPGCSTLEDFAAYGKRGTQIEEPVRVELPRRRGPQVRPLEPGPGLPAAAEAARGLRPASARPQHGRVPAHLSRGDQAGLRRSRALLRRPRVRRRAARAAAVRRATPTSAAR